MVREEFATLQLSQTEDGGTRVWFNMPLIREIQANSWIQMLGVYGAISKRNGFFF